MLVLVLENLGVLILLLAAAAGAGTLALGSREGIAFRSALGLALCAHACFFLAAIGQLHAIPIIGLLLVFTVGAVMRRRVEDRQSCLSGQPRSPVLPIAFALGAALLFLLALYPPMAVDETVYHLPFVRAFAADGALRVLPELRFPVFPVLHELLCVPASLLSGDVGPHVVALAEVIVLAALMIEWGSRYDVRAGWLAAAMFLGSPLVVQLATVLHVEIALTLFIAAGFHALDRERYALAGLFFGSACSVKYLGFYFAAAALLIVLVRRRRSAIAFTVACAAAALPMTLWIFLQTGDPLFPFLKASVWALPPPSMSWNERALRLVRMIWDATFARERIGLQPPVTPFLAIFVALVVVSAVRNASARWLLLLGAGYIAIFAFLPQDSRYLVPLLPLVSIAAALVLARWPKATLLLALLAIGPGIAYAGYRLLQQGIPPSTSLQRSEWLAARLPGYRALSQAGTERTYACGGERLTSYARGAFLGDYNGPHSYDRILGGNFHTKHIAERIGRIDARYFLFLKRACGWPMVDNGGMELVYEDADAQLWRVSSDAHSGSARPAAPR